MMEILINELEEGVHMEGCCVNQMTMETQTKSPWGVTETHSLKWIQMIDMEEADSKSCEQRLHINILKCKYALKLN